jgi:restriction endonuclease S subunit
LAFNINKEQIQDIIVPELPDEDQKKIAEEFTEQQGRIKETVRWFTLDFVRWLVTF